MQDGVFRSKTCPYCEAPITPNALIRPGHCDAPDCATAHAVEGHRAVVKVRKERHEEAIEALRKTPAYAEHLAENGLAGGPEPVLAAVPFQGRPLVPLPKERVDEFTVHLRAAIDEAFAASQDEVDALVLARNFEPEERFFAAGCGACQGKCCLLGAGSNAFITAQTIMGHRQLWPELTPEIIYDNYVEYLPDEATEDGCLYQAIEGCNLPREMRSSICNSFHCHELEAGLEKAKADPDKPVVIVSVKEGDEVPRKFATVLPV